MPGKTAAYPVSDFELERLAEQTARISAAREEMQTASSAIIVNLQEAGVPESHPAMREARALNAAIFADNLKTGRLLRAAGR